MWVYLFKEKEKKIVEPQLFICKKKKKKTYLAIVIDC